MGIHVERVRFITLLLASVITAVCVSFLGIIGFVGIICPHVVKKLLGQDHRFSIPLSCLAGSILLLLADTLSRCVGSGSALPVGAITSLLGAPFFIAIIFSRKEKPKVFPCLFSTGNSLSIARQASLNPSVLKKGRRKHSNTH